MILRALYDYYQRCGDIAPKGMEYKEIGFLIVISKDGEYLRVEDCRLDKKTCSTFLVAKTVNRSGIKAGMFPCLLWDNTRFVLGMPKDDKQNPDGQYLDAFRKMVKDLSEKYPDSERLCAVNKFYERYPGKNLSMVFAKDILYKDLMETAKNISFRVHGDLKIVAEDSFLRNEIQGEEKDCDDVTDGKICLVTGKKAKIARIHSRTPLPGAQFASLISFQKGSGFDSYGKEQAYNAPVSIEAEDAYTTALNRLLGKDSHNKFSIGTRTFLFWASSNSEASKASEDSLFSFFGRSEENDDPNRRIEFVRQTFMSIYNGKLASDKDDRFYILGIAPNSGRESVVYWTELPLREFAKVITRHFEDMEITDPRKDKKPYAGLHAILGAVTQGGKSSDAAPNLPDAVAKSIFQGLPYPVSLFQSCIRRIRAEQDVSPYNSPCRVAIIKAYLNRLNDNNNKKLNIMLDKENQNQGYLCGRLFAVLDKIQEDANDIHSIRERYMNAASATPASVFATMLNLSSHHLEKLNGGRQVDYEKLKQEIIDKMPAEGFPAHLDLQDQGRFFVGYYHQRQDLFCKKKEQSVTE